ncbi:hypothetical protein JCM10908_006449 [Rhodotorula pacifica]|uniref:E3 ubiquitin-protein ligase MARCH n=1 Tax=Rhodotorula pacifica TaxID=1495444 RepID=UPI00316DD494
MDGSEDERVGTSELSATPRVPQGGHEPVQDEVLNDGTSDAKYTADSQDVGEDDERTCRICFAAGDDEDGRLIAPCRCSGTARYVHQGCLRSWREADRKNSFYKCTQCGETYRFRSSMVANSLGHPFATPFLTILVLLCGGYLCGFLADRALVYTERDLLRTNGKLSQSWINHRALGDGLREFSSALGVLVGDCEWASAREEHWKFVNETKWSPTNDSVQTGWISYQYPTRHNLTTCGTYWKAETDDAVAARPGVAFFLHTARGIALAGLVEAFVGNLHRFYIAMNATIRLMRPRWLPEPPVPYVHYVPPLLAACCMDLLTWIRRRLKVSRREGYLFAPLQIQAILATTVAAGFSCHIAWVIAGWLTKKGLSLVQDLVIDLEGDKRIDGSTRGEKTTKVE